MTSNNINQTTKKTQFIILGSQVQLNKLHSHSLQVFRNFICSVVTVKDVGVWVDTNLSYASHVYNICKTYFLQMHDLRCYKQYLTDKVLYWQQMPW